MNKFLLFRYTGLFAIFFMLSLGLGYAPLNRYDPTLIPGLSDIIFYADIVKNGPDFFVDESLGIKTRLLSPSFSHLFYILLPQFGTMNAVSAAMLVGNSIFTALSVVLIFDIIHGFFRDSNIALTAGFLFITSFFITNSYLVGSIDAAYGFFFLVLYSAIIRDKWFLLPFIMIFGCLTKEAFLPVASAFVMFTLIHQIFSSGRMPLSRILMFLSMLVSGSATIVMQNFLVYGSMSLPWAMLPAIEINVESTELNFGVSVLSVSLYLFRFFLTLGLLLLLCLASLQKYPAWFLTGNVGTIFIVFPLGAYMSLGGANMTGVDYARFLFSPAALLLCGAAAMTISKFQIKLSK